MIDDVQAVRFPPIEFIEEEPTRDRIIAIIKANPGGVLLGDLQDAVGGTCSRFYQELSGLANEGVIVRGKAKGRAGRLVTAYRLRT